MSKRMVWDQMVDRKYETGVKKVALYPMTDGDTYGAGVPWNGITAVNESPEGGEPSPLYADDIKYLNLMSKEELKLTIEAYTYPDEFAECDGSAEIVKGVQIGQQDHKLFGLCYRTILGNAVEGENYGYKLHLVYNCQAAPSEKEHATVNDSPEAGTFSWSVSTTPIEIPGFKPSASITIDSTKVDASKLKQLEDVLYGTESADPKLPTPEEIVEIFKDVV